MINEEENVEYLKEFKRKLEYKLIEIFDATNYVDEDADKRNDAWMEVFRHYSIKKHLLTKFEGKDIYLEKVLIKLKIN